MKSITVFCGSSFGSDDAYKEQAALLSRTLAKQNIQLVYGNANAGFMGTVAEGALSEGRKVIGTLPFF